MNTNKIIYWVATILIFLFEGVMPLFFVGSSEMQAGMAHLGYPAYFGIWLVVFKVIGGLLLVIPQVPARMKEWAYAGFTFDFVWALISHLNVDPTFSNAIMPVIALVILMISYSMYHYKLNQKII